MKNYFFKLIPPRTNFPADITAAEANLMQQHSQYWRGLMNQGMVVAFGPVADPTASFGVAIVQIDDDADANSLGTNDPTVKAHAGFSFEIHPMPRLVLPGDTA